MPSTVVKSTVTGDPAGGAEFIVTSNAYATVPALPSLRVTSVIEINRVMQGPEPAEQAMVGRVPVNCSPGERLAVLNEN